MEAFCTVQTWDPRSQFGEEPHPTLHITAYATGHHTCARCLRTLPVRGGSHLRIASTWCHVQTHCVWRCSSLETCAEQYTAQCALRSWHVSMRYTLVWLRRSRMYCCRLGEKEGQYRYRVPGTGTNPRLRQLGVRKAEPILVPGSGFRNSGTCEVAKELAVHTAGALGGGCTCSAWQSGPRGGRGCLRTVGMRKGRAGVGPRRCWACRRGRRSACTEHPVRL